MSETTRCASSQRRSVGTRRSLLATVGVALSSAGCLADPFGDSYGPGGPDPDHAVSLRSDAEETHAVRVWVVREETGETVFETTREIEPGVSVELFNTRRANPDGIESFRVCGELVGTTGEGSVTTTTESRRRDCQTIRTDDCHGGAEVVVRDDRSVQIVYAIC